MLEDYRETVFGKNTMQMAAGVVMGMAFGVLVNSFVNEIVMPLINLTHKGAITGLYLVVRNGNPPGPYLSMAAAEKAGAVIINYGQVLNVLINFIIIGLSVYVVARILMSLGRKSRK
jgi:large conductance mechanosensitive channel